MKRKGLLTIGDLRKARKLLEVSCMNCTDRNFLDPLELSLPDTLPIVEAAAIVDCPSCKSKNSSIRFPIYVRADARVGIDSVN